MALVFRAVTVLSLVIGTIHADSSCQHESTPVLSKCTGCPPTYNGKLCASTTRYTDLTRGACGCGQDPNPTSFWTKSSYTAALNCMYLDPSNPTLSWCPNHCGKCFKLCATGGTTSGALPSSSASSQCITVQITNRCGDGYKASHEAQWCRQEMTPSQCQANPGQCASNRLNTNNYGYSAHFDLQNVNGQIDALGWDNVEVTFEEVDCATGSFGDWQSTCYCSEDQSGSGSSGSGSSGTDNGVDYGSGSGNTGDSGSSNSGSITITQKDGANAWWYAVTLSTPSGVTVTNLKMKGSGMWSWETGVAEWE